MESIDISVIMGIFNCEDTLEESLDSIINQTYSKWEIIMCDDGSTDNTYNIAKRYCEKYPKKIKLIKNDVNKGLTYSLNHCIKYCRGEYIARQDGDDRSIKYRFEKQIKVMKMNKNIGIVSSKMNFFDENGIWGQSHVKELPQSMDFVKCSPFSHGASMYRLSLIKKIGGYRDIKLTLRVEDYDLWFRMYAYGTKGMNINEVLYEARDDRNAIIRRKYKYRINEAYVKFNGFKMLRLPVKSYVYVLRPLLVGMLPKSFYKKLRKLYINILNK